MRMSLRHHPVTFSPAIQRARFHAIGPGTIDTDMAKGVVLGVLLFSALGKDPLRGLQMFFVEPVKSMYALSELAMKAAGWPGRSFELPGREAISVTKFRRVRRVFETRRVPLAAALGRQ